MKGKPLYTSILSLLCANIIEAFGSGAGHCMSGTPSIFKSSHGSSGSGELQSGDITISTSTNTSNLAEITTVETGTEYKLTINSVKGQAYKGFLVRVSDKNNGDASGVVTENTIDTKSLSLCEANVVGITHTNRNLKSGISMALKSNLPIELLVEVTVVIENSMGVKDAYYYSAYELSMQDALTSSPTPLPTRSLTPAPTNLPTPAPTSSPTAVPETTAPTSIIPLTPSTPTISPTAAESPAPTPEPSPEVTMSPGSFYCKTMMYSIPLSLISMTLLL